MSSQASVSSIEALKAFRAALALYGEDTLAALGAAEAEVRRTIRWLQEDRPYYWQEQVKRRRERVASARSEVFRRQLAKTADHHPAMTEQKENLRRAEASLHDAERRLVLLRKWQPAFQQAVLEYHASIGRLKNLAADDVPRAVELLGRLIDSLEAYLRVAPPSGSEITAKATAELQTIATTVLDQEPADEVSSSEPPNDAVRPGEESSGTDPDDS